jgi:hypothetical protein
VASSDRYFPATILGGRLHVRGLPDWGPWNLARLEWADEEFVNMFVGTDPIHRKARTREELEVVLNEPRGVSPTREVWIHESLVDEARRLWEQMVANLQKGIPQRRPRIPHVTLGCLATAPTLLEDAPGAAKGSRPGPPFLDGVRPMLDNIPAPRQRTPETPGEPAAPVGPSRQYRRTRTRPRTRPWVGGNAETPVTSAVFPRRFSSSARMSLPQGSSHNVASSYTAQGQTPSCCVP